MILRIMLIFAVRYNAHAPHKNLHIIRRYAKSVYNSKKPSPATAICRIKFYFMADIKISYVTPRHFYESVQLLRTAPHGFRFSDHSITIEFDRTFALDFAKLEHLADFLRELEHSSVPVDLDEFIKQYRRQPKPKFFKRRY